MKTRTISVYILVLLDMAAAMGAVFLSKWIEIRLPFFYLPDPLLSLKAFAFMLITVFCYYFQDFYDWKWWRRHSELVSTVLIGGGMSLIILSLAYYIIPQIELSRSIFLMSLFFSMGFSLLIRVIYIAIRDSRLADTRVVLLGNGRNAKFLVDEIRLSGRSVKFEGYVGKENTEMDIPWLGDVDELWNIIRGIDPDKLVVAFDDMRGALPLHDLLRIKLTSCEIEDAPKFYEELLGKIMIEDVRPGSLIFAKGFASMKSEDILKRLFDFFFALVGTVIASPFMIITAIAIKIDSPGPVFYKQERVGLNGREFKVFKFRSMRTDAENDGPQWASEKDPRVTRVGNIIRKTRIDELPQFLNVLIGDMSFVGPRPERRYFIDQLQQVIPFYEMRLYTKPGVTGWAQINYPYGDSVEDAREKMKYDLYYLKYRSLWLDIAILFQTLKVALKARGGQ
ncbi:MAG TPA: sugar transferase [Desulfomonilia bacterium]